MATRFLNQQSAIMIVSQLIMWLSEKREFIGLSKQTVLINGFTFKLMQGGYFICSKAGTNMKVQTLADSCQSSFGVTHFCEQFPHVSKFVEIIV